MPHVTMCRPSPPPGGGFVDLDDDQLKNGQQRVAWIPGVDPNEWASGAASTEGALASVAPGEQRRRTDRGCLN